MLQRRLCTVVGFEPQDEALAVLNAHKSDLESYYHYVVGNGHKAKLRLCRLPGMTSLLLPDQNVLSHFAKFAEWGSVVSEHQVQTRRLDDIAEIRDLDFLKIDVQGSELAVFGSGRQKLKQAVAIQTEVSFLCLYKDQPTFGDIDVELRKQGFVPHAFTSVKQRMIAPLSDPSNPHAAMNQLLEADIVYVRNFMRPADMTVEQLKHLAMISHHCYRSFDLAANCVHQLIARKAIPDQSIHDYMAFIQLRQR
nr:FkbM family methyltransferase [Bradyrhizobium diazoefficiens]